MARRSRDTRSEAQVEPERRFAVRKRTHGWWYVAEVAFPHGMPLERAVHNARIRNYARLERKAGDYEIVRASWKEARSSFQPDPEVRLLERPK